VLSAQDFELLLPWYLNGTLTDRERALVADYLAAHPEESSRVQWHTSLRAGIKAQIDEVPEDLGLDRLLARVHRDNSRAPNSFSRRSPGGALFSRWGFRPWVAAAASLAIVTVAVGTWFLVTTEHLGRPNAAIAQNRPTAAAPTDANGPTPAAVEHFGERAPPTELAKASPVSPVSPVSLLRASIARPARETPVKYGAGPASLQPTQAPEPPPDDSRLAAHGNEPSSPPQGASPEPTRLATAPASASAAPSVANETAVPGPPIAPSVSASGSHTELNPLASNPRAAGQMGVTAISGKADTRCPSTDKQREDALRAASPDEPVRKPADWLEYIKELQRAGCREAADKEWVEFFRKYPNEKVPPVTDRK